MRARNIKPGFFKNEELAQCSLYARLLFTGLWCMADREGRLEKRPLRIKAEIFPYDSLDINGELTVLERKGFIKTYVVDEKEYLHVTNFKTHQSPHHTEAKSKLPDISSGCVLTVNSPLSNGENPPDSLIPDSLIPDSLIPDSNTKPLVEYSTEFLEFWKAYPKKKAKGAAWQEWKKAKPPLDDVLDALEWQKQSAKWQEGYILDPERYIKKRCWEDEPDEDQCAGDAGESNSTPRESVNDYELRRIKWQKEQALLNPQPEAPPVDSDGMSEPSEYMLQVFGWSSNGH